MLYTRDPVLTHPSDVCTLLATPSQPRFGRIGQVLQEICGQVLHANRLAEIGKILRYRKDISVLVTEPELDDATWRDVACLTASIPNAPMLVLGLDRIDGELWMELLQRGGFGYCGEPWTEESVSNAVSNAHARWLRVADVELARADNLRHIHELARRVS